MTKDYILAVIRIYDSRLFVAGYKSCKADTSRKDLNKEDHLNHVRWMCREIGTTDLKDWSDDKIMRWLAYMQGVVAVYGFFSIDEMRAHNAPDKMTAFIQHRMAEKSKEASAASDEVLEWRELLAFIDHE